MHKKIKYLLIFTFVLGVSLTKNIVRSAFAESIKNFQSNITINKNGTVSVEEVILYDFGSLQRHGIFRDIDIVKENQEGKKFKIDIKIQSVTDENGNPYNYTIPSKSGYKSIKVGDADKLITGEHTYVIKYLVSGGISYFSDHDEFYWNYTGVEWVVPILSATSKIQFEDGMVGQFTDIACYTGPKGSTSQDCFKNIDLVTKSNIVVSTNRELGVSEGITLVASFPKGLVEVLEPKPDRSAFVDTIIGIVVTILSILWLFVLPIKILVDSLKERAFTKKNERIVAAWFEPPQYDDTKVAFSPAETGFIIDKAIDHKELTGTIIHLAQRGYLKIKQEDKNKFTFIKIKEFEGDTSLRYYEKKILEGIFSEGDEIKVSDLKDNDDFITHSLAFKKDVEEELMNNKMFEKKPSSTEMAMIGLGMFALFTMNIFLAFVALVFGRKSTKRTLVGIEKYSETRSLYNFLKSQDDKLDFQSQNQMFFEKLLPYATAFGVERIWAERFKDLKMIKPDWYEGNNFSDVMALSYMSRSLSNSVQSSMTPTRSSSGFSSGFSGGSSGGGGGGGGGGSW